jgi:hypothetical protein
MKVLSRFMNRASAVALLSFFASAGVAVAGGNNNPRVLLISIDGMHEADIAVCVSTGNCPNIAGLLTHGIHFTNAQAPKPTDSFPGILAQFTGALPKTTGVYYDDSYDRTLYSPKCAKGPGAEVTLAENVDFNSDSIDGGKPGNLKSLNAGEAINPDNLPGQKSGPTCAAVYPHNLGRTNTIVGVLRGHGYATAWADKHPAYDLLNGPGLPNNGPASHGLNDFFAPEINSLFNQANLDLVKNAGLTSTYPLSSPTSSGDFTKSADGVKYYDGIKVGAVLNWIKGYTHNGDVALNPAFFGMNFQAVSVSQKLKVCSSNPQYTGGYTDGAATPGPCLKDSVKWVDAQIGAMVQALGSDGREKTLIIISAKHGQSPIDPALRKTYPDGTVIEGPIGSALAFQMSDDGSLIWLNDRSKTADAVAALQSYSTANGDGQGHNGTGIGEYLYGPPLASVFGVPGVDPRTPDIITIANVGTIYTTGSKLAEHGGFNEDDYHVALLVSHPSLGAIEERTLVSTAQIAPTILKGFGINPLELDGVRAEGTQPLPGIFRESDHH